MRDGLLMTSAGVALGIPAAIAGATVLKSLLFRLTPASPLILMLAGGGFVLLGAIATLAPALRAASVTPATALRATNE